MIPQSDQCARILAKDSVVIRSLIDMQRRLRHSLLDLQGARHVCLGVSLARHEQCLMCHEASELLKIRLLVCVIVLSVTPQKFQLAEWQINTLWPMLTGIDP